MRVGDEIVNIWGLLTPDQAQAIGALCVNGFYVAYVCSVAETGQQTRHM